MTDTFDPLETVGAAKNPPTSDNEPRPANDAGRELTEYLERIERLESDKSEIADDIKGVKGEMKTRGYDMKVVGEMLKLRKMDKGEREEFESLRDTYGHSIGIFG